MIIFSKMRLQHLAEKIRQQNVNCNQLLSSKHPSQGAFLTPWGRWEQEGSAILPGKGKASWTCGDARLKRMAGVKRKKLVERC